jgi:hypothetical protein
MIVVECDGRWYGLTRDSFTGCGAPIDLRSIILHSPVAFEINGMKYSGVATMVDPGNLRVSVRCIDHAAISGESTWTFQGDDLDCAWKVEPPPRRRTEPAITVPPEPDGRCQWTHQYGSGAALQCVRPRGHLHGCEYQATTSFKVQSLVFTGDVEAAKAHGAAAYVDLAATMEQVRMLAHAAWVRSLPVWQPDETCGDYAARAGILPPKPGRREQWEDSVWLAAAERMAIEGT